MRCYAYGVSSARVAVVGLVAACAHPVAAKPPATAAQVFAAMRHVYASATTYVDHGDIAATVRSGAKTQTTTGTFRTDHERRGRLRFEYQGAEMSHPLVLWSDGATATQVSGDTESEPASEKFGGFNILTKYISGLVLGELRNEPASLTEVDHAQVQGVESIDGHPCWKIAGAVHGGARTLWVDQSSFVVRKLTEHDRISASESADVDLMAHYVPELDVAIASGRLDRPAPDPPREPEHPQWIGVGFHSGGATVDRVYKDSPADTAGFRAGDEIKKLDGQLIDVTKFREAMATSRPGAAFAVTVERAGQEVTLHVAPAPRPELATLQQGLVDKPAPPFALARISGTASPKLADLAGNVVVVDFWATWCGPCRMSMPHLDALSAKYATKGLRIIGVTDEDAATVNEFLKANPVGYTLATDPDDAIASAYLVQGLPTLMVLDRSGVVRYEQVGVGDFAALDGEIAELLAQPAKPSNLPP